MVFLRKDIHIQEIDSIVVISEPKSLQQALSSAHKNQWLDAMQDELKSLKSNKTWEIVDLPPDRKAFGSKWVYKIKYSADGQINRYKARLVAQGFSQKYGIDYDEVFAPVVTQTTFRILLAVATKRKMNVYHMDVIYMKQPPGFIDEQNSDKVCLLKRSLYVLKQSARVWNHAIHELLMKGGY